MFALCQETKVMRDPVHGYIHIRYQVIWDCINTPVFQRLRRIHQLGGTYQVYHTAEHSRFSHSLGVYEVVRRMISEVDDLRQSLSEYEQVALLCAGLLHDVGHGPFSHAFEGISHEDHEHLTVRLIREDPKLRKVLDQAHPDLAEDVCRIIEHTHQRPLLSQVISSQIDADRMDYLLRDSYNTGVSYGEFDLGRILRTLRVVEETLVIKESGMHAVEDYIMARYHMYWQVYYHPVSRAYEHMLQLLFARLYVCGQADPKMTERYPFFAPLIRHKPLSLDEFFRLDEAACYTMFSLMRTDPDNILKDLARRILDRDLFGYEDICHVAQPSEMAQKLQNCGYDPTYYLAVDHAQQTPYSPYEENASSLIWVVYRDGSRKELSVASSIVGAIVHGEKKIERKMFYPKEMTK